MNPVSQRLLSQQLAAPQFKDPAEVVSWFGAMQAQDYKSMRWAVSMRTPRPSGKAFEKAYNDGRIVRTHLLRTTWQLLAGEDLGWMLKLCRRKALAGLRGWMHANGVDIPADEEKRISGIFGEALAGHRSVQKEFLAEALRARDIQMTEQRFSYHLRLAELSGLLCSGDLHPTKRTLALAAEKVRNPLVLSHEEALALLTDFYVHAEARTRGFRRGSVLLLPAFDEYLIGYKSRDIVLHPDHSHHAHNNSGIFYPIVALDGYIVGNWSPSAHDGGLTLFDDDTTVPAEPFHAQLATYRSTLKLKR